ncbi:MAG: class I SAM-dependent methyltransferase [Candidatus Aenigmarchaeota archaeon]|nr:class I SAM-dependent methyltransferase [Candidatus Aenigmarchaeota archaeon]
MKNNRRLWEHTGSDEHAIKTLHEYLKAAGIGISILDDAILDVGCGEASFLEAAGKYHPRARLIGIDTDPDAVEAAKKRVPNADIRLANAQQIPFPSGSFTVVHSAQLFYYDGFWDPPKTLEVPKVVAEIYRVLNRGGIYWMREEGDPGYDRETLTTAGFHPLNKAYHVFQKRESFSQMIRGFFSTD